MRRALLAATVAVAALLLAGCTPAAVHPADPEPSYAGPAKVTVKRKTIIPVLSLGAEVRSDVEYQVTAPVAGTIRRGAHDQPVITAPDGTTHAVDLPTGARITDILVADGQRVAKGLPIALATETGFALVAAVEGADLLRFAVTPLSAKAQIVASGSPFDCRFLDPRPTTLPDSKDEHLMACQIPDDQPVVLGMTGTIAFRFPGATDVLTLPTLAVAGTLDNGAVTLVRGGSRSTVKVGLGITDGFDVQITSGLHEGDTVEVPSPSLFNG
ncbi:hypothetical protein [Galbitalea soli]|uniref:Efflux RND transporter periplasmic adaptor subunit n=1 Tax=Galbitalea soli TaxID=1268042 RepID=A0A7C9PPN1_9MICO|nr:hypothetical protein [Galbitalea soli]NEM92494.1 hypothetical protein [Galbitalea soli]NYJ29531.1 multidrug efflux pump subunit AcrA (membrane-fusion protein) [Galbitalea soli]